MIECAIFGSIDTMWGMNVTFYFDPICPFCWITSRWLLLVSNDRDINITWRPFSLALKNNKLADGDEHDISAHRVLRVMQAVQEKNRAMPLIDLYTAFGIQKHIAGREYDDELILDVLEELKLPAELLAAADDTQYDEVLNESINEAIEVVGDDVGVPTIVFDLPSGERNGFFGPVLEELPSKEASLDIWDGLSKLAADKAFYELKRTRPDGNPNTGSTARC